MPTEFIRTRFSPDARALIILVALRSALVNTHIGTVRIRFDRAIADLTNPRPDTDSAPATNTSFLLNSPTPIIF